MESFLIGIASSLAAAFIIFLLGKKAGLWRSKNPKSIELATRVLKYLDNKGTDKINKTIYATKQLGDSLAIYYKNKTPYKVEFEKEALELIDELVLVIKPLSSELTAADKELDGLKRAIVELQSGLEWRAQIVKHLCSPPNPHKMDPGHVRDQLLSINLLPNDLLNAARGEAALFLRGNGINWLVRQKYRREIIKKQKALYDELVAKEYRKVLRQTSLHKAKQ
jgi:hypothetical protein